MLALGAMAGRVMPGKLIWPGAGGVYGMRGDTTGAGVRGVGVATGGVATGGVALRGSGKSAVGGVGAKGVGVTGALLGGVISGNDIFSLGYHLPLEYSHFPSLLVGTPYSP